MKRVTEKVKDIVEVRAFTHVHDFAADPALTLANYYFTDITSDLMAKWVEKVASVKSGNGTSVALAGFRGVGKSHFLAVLAAIVSQPELRSRITDAHVASLADRLSRRRNAVVFVRRGSGSSLLEELKTSIAGSLKIDVGDLGDTLSELLKTASEKAGESPLVLLVDTALGREARVKRDDGAVLGEIAEAAKALGIFVGVALDDDISGADGANSSISRNFTIDYLDQEHLYKIVDSHIFSKHSTTFPILHDIYDYYREVLPGFQWSEVRFSSLYPLHPATLEIAPLIRLYIQDFALLGFASEAGVKILGRPANSLIGLDEVFDSVENKLRAVPDLREAFEAYDRVEREVIARAPVQTRLQAKLILKGLVLLSLDGQGSTAAHIAASMLIFNEYESAPDAINVEGLLNSFASALPDSIEKSGREGEDVKYCFRLSGKESINSVLAESIKDVSEDVVWDILLKQPTEKYGDVDGAGDFGPNSAKCNINWRGSIRRGEIVWESSGGSNALVLDEESKDPIDWRVLVDTGREGKSTNAVSDNVPTYVWKVAEPTAEEKDTIRRHHLLQTNADVREQFKESISTSIHIHTLAVEKVWQRIFFQEGKLVAGDTEYRFDEKAQAAHSLAQLFTGMLNAVFETQYPLHPEFQQFLDKKQTESLITNFFGGAEPNNTDVQHLAEVFALPLGLAVKPAETYVPVQADSLNEVPIIQTAFDGADGSNDTMPLSEVSAKMLTSQLGLTSEAQHLILAAVVAQRRFEFVTSSGNRINHRSLDLRIVWEDIAGLAKPLNEVYSSDRLLAWARHVTGDAGLPSLDKSAERIVVQDALSNWLSDWKLDNILGQFDNLPDEDLNAAIWKTTASLRKSFGVVAESIESMTTNDMTLDQCLQSIADLFSDSESDYDKRKKELNTLSGFIKGVARRNEIVSYLSACEIIDNPEVEMLRGELLSSADIGHFTSAVMENKGIDELWLKFRQAYSDHYLEKHNQTMAAIASGQKLEEVLRTDSWSQFENLSAVPWFGRVYGSRAMALIREIRQNSCSADVMELLRARPLCSCAFSLAASGRMVRLTSHLQTLIFQGLAASKNHLAEQKKELVTSLNQVSPGEHEDAMKSSMTQILDSLHSEDGFQPLTGQDVHLLKLAAAQMSDGQVNAGDLRPFSEFDDFSQNDLHEIAPKPQGSDSVTNIDT